MLQLIARCRIGNHFSFYAGVRHQRVIIHRWFTRLEYCLDVTRMVFGLGVFL